MIAPRAPFRADHVGSLLRSPALKARRREREAGRIDAAALAAAEDEAVREAVRIQERAGLEGITDGEQRRKSWHMDFLTRLGGLSSEGGALPVTFHGRAGDVNFTRPDLRIDAPVGRPANRPLTTSGDPANRAVTPSFARSSRRVGANWPMPPIWMPMDEKFANPQRA